MFDFDFSKEELCMLGYLGPLQPEYPQWTWGRTFTYRGKYMRGTVCSTTKNRWGDLSYSTHKGEVRAWEDEEGNLFDLSGFKTGETVQIPSLEEFQKEILSELYKRHDCNSILELQSKVEGLRAKEAQEEEEFRESQAQEEADRKARMEQLTVLVEQLNQLVSIYGYTIQFDLCQVWVKTQRVGYDFEAHIWEPAQYTKGLEALKAWVDSLRLPPLLKTGKVPPKKRAK